MNYTSSRKANLSLALIAVFTIVLLTLISLAAWRNNASNNLREAIKDLGTQGQVVRLADESIAKFFQIENAFHLYKATGVEQYKAQYIKGLTDLRRMLTFLER